MSELKKLTGFLKDDLPSMSRLAGEAHDAATAAKLRFERIVGDITADLTDFVKEVDELEAAYRQTSNHGPKLDDGSSFRTPLDTTSDLPKPN